MGQAKKFENKINIYHLIEGAKKAEGLTVIIDVFRAFSLECYLYGMGVKEIRPVGEIEEAFSLKEALPNSVLVGERRGKKCEGFDFGNSPSAISKEQVVGKTIIHTTSSGTQGIVNANGADEIITGSLVNAKAVAEYIMEKQPEVVSLVCMGNGGVRPAAEDELCAEYIKSILEGNEMPDLEQRVEDLQRNGGEHFFDKSSQDVFPEADFWMCTKYNQFPFVIRIEKDDMGLVAKKVEEKAFGYGGNMKVAAKEFLEQLSQNETLYEAYQSFLQCMKEKMEEDSQEFISFEEAYTKDFQRGVESDKQDRNIIIQGERLVIREAHIEDSEFMSSVECHEDNSPWVANWPLGWRVAKFGDPDFLQVIVEREDGTPIGFIIFRDMLNKENAVQLKRIAIIDKGKGYGKETLHLAQKMAFEIFGTQRLYLGTKPENLRAQSIYKATGFTPDMPDPCTGFHMDREDYSKIITAHFR